MNELTITLVLKGESSYFINFVKTQSGMEYTELFAKMIDLYKQIYLNEHELAWVHGDTIVKKLSVDNLKRTSL